jgi:DNA-cytosine methyltransferase
MEARMQFGSVCSGIEAASVAWNPLGWRAAWLSEIEPFPAAVLAHHYPDVPNLGDMTTLPARIASGEVDAPDVLCGGTPCQSWSVAGKRGGADDPRGQLTFSFLRIAEVSKPRFIVWENVPGILSVDKGRPFCQFLDGLLALGYVVNCDILDAQFFGLAQRRRRVFVVCQHASFLMKEKSNISVTIGAIAVLGILQNILAALHQESGSSPEKLAAKCANVRDGLERKIKCFSVQSEEILQTWLQNLAEAFLSAATDREYWELNLGPGTKTAANSSQSVGTQLSVFQDETASRSLCLSTSQSWKSELEDLFSALKSFTTLTELKAITAQKICIYAEMLHTIGWFIAQSKESCPHLLKLESLHSTLTKEFTKYARQADEPFFRGERFFGFWDDFSSKARASIDLIASARNDFDPAKVLFEFDRVRRDTAPSREAREATSSSPSVGVGIGGQQQQYYACGGIGAYHNSSASATLLKTGQDLGPGCEAIITMAHGQGGAEIATDRSPKLTCNHEAPIAAYGIPGNWIGRKPENGGNAVEPMHNVAPCLTSTDRHGVAVGADCYNGSLTGDVACTMGTPGSSVNASGPTVMVPIGFHPGKSGKGWVGETPFAVRRLTVEECEFLQGFPRGYTAIPWRKKPASDCPDGPRYKALGNSWAVPVVRWIGERISSELFMDQTAKPAANDPKINQNALF